MSFLSKLKFWHKEDDFDFDSIANEELGQKPLDTANDPTGLDQQSAAPNKTSPFSFEPQKPSLDQHPSQPSTQSGSNDSKRELELINSKLDTLKALLTSIDQRLAMVERASVKEKKEQRLW